VRISDVARQLGFSTDHIRELEKAGRIPPVLRDTNGHRRYTQDDMERLRRVLFSQRKADQD